MKLKVFSAIVILCLIWSSLWGFIKHSLLFFPPLQFISVRLILAALALIVLQRSFKKSILPDRQDWRKLIISSLMICIGFYTTQILAMQFVDSGLSAILVFTMPISAALLSHFILNERLNSDKSIGLLFAVLGIVIILWPQFINLKWNISLIGQLGLIVSGFFWALTTVYVKKHFATYDKIKLTLWQMLIGGSLLFIPAIILEPVKPSDWINPFNGGLLFYIAVIGTGFAFALWNWILSQVDTFSATMSVMSIPVLSLVFGAVFWHEVLSLNIIVGAILICIGIVLNALRVKNALSNNALLDGSSR